MYEIEGEKILTLWVKSQYSTLLIIMYIISGRAISHFLHLYAHEAWHRQVHGINCNCSIRLHVLPSISSVNADPHEQLNDPGVLVQPC